jgi:hypothetical protein
MITALIPPPKIQPTDWTTYKRPFFVSYTGLSYVITILITVIFFTSGLIRTVRYTVGIEYLFDQRNGN